MVITPTNIENNPEKKQKSILGILLLLFCFIGIVVLVGVFINMISPSSDKEIIYTEEELDTNRRDLVKTIKSYINHTTTAINDR